MAVTLLDLPAELVVLIIEYCIPESFECLAISCKTLYIICVPHISSFNALSRRFRAFDLSDFDRLVVGDFHQPSSSFDPVSAFHLLTKIISKPVVARYIVHLDLSLDSLDSPLMDVFPDVKNHHISALTALISSSPYVHEAGLDPEDLAAEIKNSVRAGKYSQLAATFLLTLLPNLESLVLPMLWQSTETSSRLLDVLVRRAISSSEGATSVPLAQLRTVSNCTAPFTDEVFPLSWARPFLALPELRMFEGCCIVDEDNDDGGGSSSPAPFPMGVSKNLTCLELTSSDVACHTGSMLAKLLADLSRLTSLTYIHEFRTDETKQGLWDAAEFLELVAVTLGKDSGDGVGGKLDRLCVVAHVDYGRDVRSLKYRARGQGLRGGKFPRLKTLDLPFGFINANNTRSKGGKSVPASRAKEDRAKTGGNAWLEFVPESVERLGFVGKANRGDRLHGINRFFQNFNARNRVMLPKLIELGIPCTSRSTNKYRAQCDKLKGYCEEGGVTCWLDGRRFTEGDGD